MNLTPVVLADRAAVIDEVAERAVSLLLELSSSRERVDVCLTGGTVGIGVLAAIAAHTRAAEIVLDRLHWWWGDERFVAADSEDRNEKQAREALLDVLGVDESHINALPASDEDLSLEQSATAATHELEAAQPFALTFLGLGPDGHIASLFPGHPAASTEGAGVIAVTDSPKPPSERLSLTFDSINASERIWIAAAGDDKADAVAAAMQQPGFQPVPGGSVRGTHETLLFADEAAASRL